MKHLKCTQCGANINSKTLTCDYCGSVFLSSEIETNKNKVNKTKNLKDVFHVRDLSNQEIASLIKSLFSRNIHSEIFVLIFMFFWTATAIFMVSVIPNDILIAKLVPSFFVLLGVYMIIIRIKSIINHNVSKEVKLISEGKFDQAKQILLSKQTKKVNSSIVGAIIILDYFKLDNFDEARSLIIKMSPLELTLLINTTSVFLEIANNLGVKTPDFNPNLYSHNSSYGGGYTTKL